MNLAPNVDSLEIQSEKRERTFIKLIVGGLVGLVALVALAYAGFHFLHQWQERHSVRRAAAYLGGGDTKAAALSARRALQMNPANTDASRLMAQIAEHDGDRSAVDWWRKVISREPANTDDIFAFARSALNVHDLAAVEKALKSLDVAAKETAEFHAIAAQLAQGRKDAVQAEDHWFRANQIAPDNTTYQFQLASARLATTDPTKRDLARKSLENLRLNPKRRAEATRTLVLDGMSNHLDIHEIQPLASDLQAYPDATFADRLLFLEILRQSQDPGFASYLDKLKLEAAPQPVDLANLLSWMSNNENARSAIEFAKNLPGDSLDKWPVYPALAAAYIALKDWPGLEQMTRTTHWPPSDFLRHAYLSRALREQNGNFAAEQEWLTAQKEAAGRSQSLFLLARTAASWGWESEKVDLLWLLAKNEDTKLAALETLYEHYSKLGDTAGLYHTLLRLVESLPSDLALQNNLAQISLLLGIDVEHACKVAADIKDKEPSNGAFVSTYAFSLYSKGDAEGALRAMEQLRSDQLRDPAVAAYYGLALASAGRKEQARDYLHRATETNLLPEEKALVAKAQASLK